MPNTRSKSKNILNKNESVAGSTSSTLANTSGTVEPQTLFRPRVNSLTCCPKVEEIFKKLYCVNSPLMPDDAIKKKAIGIVNELRTEIKKRKG